MRIPSDPLLVLFLLNACVIAVIRFGAERRSRAQATAKDHRSRQDRLLLMAAISSMVILPGLFLFTDLLGFADYRLPEGLGWAGAPFLVAGTVMLWRTHADLGDNFSKHLQIHHGHQLVTRGVYGRVRHPMYAAMLLASLGQALILQNWLAGPSMLVVVGLFIALRVPAEEQMLVGQFGDAYRQYQRDTGAVLPKPRASRHP